MEKLRAQPDHKPYAICYGEWLHRKRGTSWKVHIAEYIDHLIPLAKNLDELLKIMEAHGYTVKRGYYISVKTPEQGRAVRLKTLGVDYTENMLRQRIQDYLDAQPKQRTIAEACFCRLGQNGGDDINSFMSWIGGKKSSRDIIIPKFPLYYEKQARMPEEVSPSAARTQRKQRNFETFEVFGDGGWILFAKPPGNDFEIFNDYNSNI